MANEYYLAMTAGEFQNCSSLPEKNAWMSCHFSPWGKGLSNLPQALPPGAMLMLDDSSPIHGHDPETVLSQLSRAVNALNCGCVLLDFQRRDCAETADIAAYLAKNLPCPVGVSHIYAKGLECAVLLPPVPPDFPLAEYIQPWAGREIWLELALSPIGYRITKEGASPFQPTVCPEQSFVDGKLCCHYVMDIRQESADFTLFRTKEDITALAEKASAMGITRCVGLWQELHS